LFADLSGFTALTEARGDEQAADLVDGFCLAVRRLLVEHRAQEVKTIGDAGYYRDAITAYGISGAFRDAELLAAALDQALGGVTEETMALAAYQEQRDQALREIFEITCRLAAYPPVPTFIELQKQLSAAIDKEAAVLAARPIPGERPLATA
jgi:class 3 adenylate cyclase